METTIKNWWLAILIGIVSIGLGIWCASAPIQTLVALSIIFIIGFIISGITNIVLAITNKGSKSWVWTLVSGILDLLIAIAFIAMPGITLLFMIMFVGIWILFQSILGFKIARELQLRAIGGSAWIIVLSILGIILSIFLILNPSFASEFIVMLTSISFIIYGMLRVYFGFKLKQLKNIVEKGYK